MFSNTRTSNPSDAEITVSCANVGANMNANTITTSNVQTYSTPSVQPSVLNGSALGDDAYLTCHQLMGEYTGPVESVLPREFRQRLHKHFALIEREFEREYRKLYSLNLALQERLEKFEEGDHLEAITVMKKLGTSMLSQRIKQQYKQSTSRLVSSLRPSSGHATTTSTTNLLSGILSGGPVHSFAMPSVLAGSFPQHAGSWQLTNRIVAHKDGIWEVTPFRRFLATASADNTVRLWVNDSPLNCLFVYLGHSGSVNSVRFRNRDHLMLTSSGDGTTHLIRLPYDLMVKAATSISGGSAYSTALDAVGSALATEVAGTGAMDIGMGNSSKCFTELDAFRDQDEHNSSQAGAVVTEEDSPVRSVLAQPVSVQHPHAIFQSANLYSSGANSRVDFSWCNSMESSPLSAADFVPGREQIVTASWDRLGRTYDLSTGQELECLSGHDHQLTDVRGIAGATSPIVVTSSRDCTFRLWDFRQPGMRVHVQQAHNQAISTTQFLTSGSPERLISCGADRYCRIWDLRNSRGPVVAIRTDSSINRLGLSGSLQSQNIVDQLSDVSSTTTTSQSNVDHTSCPAHAPSGGISSGQPTANPNMSAAANTTWSTSYVKLVALPLDNRGIKICDLQGNRIGRLARSTHGHSHMVTSVAWADEGVSNFFSTGFDSRLLAWQIFLTNV